MVVRSLSVALRPLGLALAAGLALASAAFAPSALAHDGPPSKDMTGVWWNWGPETPPQFRSDGYPIPPPLTEAGKERSKFLSDPRNNLGQKCLPAGGPAGLMNPRSFFPMEIIQKDKQVTMIFELMQQVRRVYTDGRKLPADPEPTWMGYSVGRWEGDVLVIETTGVKGGVLNGAGAAVTPLAHDVEWRMPYSPKLRLTERLRLIENGEVLRSDMVIEDPVYYTQPMKFVRFWKRNREQEMMEYICAENPRPELEGAR